MNLIDKTVPVFFASDDAYAPFLGVAIRSLLASADPKRFYRIHILTEGLTAENTAKLLAEQTDNAVITFDDVKDRVAAIAADLHMRDYYSAATYYRIFIGDLYPEYHKALYLDSDLVFVGDVCQLYDTDLGDAIVGAIRDDVVAMEQVFGDYVATVVGVPADRYFNAGVLLLNLERYRALSLETRFLELLRRRRFTVAQDQDYLNCLCYGQVYFFDSSWNHSAVKGALNDGNRPNIVHYKMDWKPWHSDGILFEELFWAHADASAFADDIRAIRAAYTDGERRRDAMARERLVETARRETVEILTGKEAVPV